MLSHLLPLLFLLSCPLGMAALARMEGGGNGWGCWAPAGVITKICRSDALTMGAPGPKSQSPSQTGGRT